MVIFLKLNKYAVLTAMLAACLISSSCKKEEPEPPSAEVVQQAVTNGSIWTTQHSSRWYGILNNVASQNGMTPDDVAQIISMDTGTHISDVYKGFEESAAAMEASVGSQELDTLPPEAAEFIDEFYMIFETGLVETISKFQAKMNEPAEPEYVVLSDVLPKPLGEWYSVRNGVFMRAAVDGDDLYLSIQNQAVYSYFETMLVLSSKGKDVYAFFLPASLIPPYDYQTDYVAVSADSMKDIDEFRIVMSGEEKWNQLLLLAEYTETELFTQFEDGIRGALQNIEQTRYRSTFEELDFSNLAPDIQWTPARAKGEDDISYKAKNRERMLELLSKYEERFDILQENRAEYFEVDLSALEELVKWQAPNVETTTAAGDGMDIAADASILQGEPAQSDLSTVQQTGNQSMYDLRMSPIIEHAGLKFSEFELDRSIMSFKGTVQNTGNKGIETIVEFEFLDEDWQSLGVRTYGPEIPSLNETQTFYLNVSSSMVGARFVRVVSE
jgi:hypothetical protein